MSLLAAAQKPSVIPLIPAANWRLLGSREADLSAVQSLGGDAAIEREYGVKSITERTYELNGHRAQASLEEASDPSSAYGLLTIYQTEAMRPDKYLQLTVCGSEGALMVRGRYFIRVARPANYPLPDVDFRALLILIGGARASTLTAVLPLPLPTRGLVPGSGKYLLGSEAARRVLPSFRTDLIGFEQGAEVQTAKYVAGGSNSGRATLILISYPTPQIARSRFGTMEKRLRWNQERGAESTFARRQGSYVLVVLDSQSQIAGKKLLDEFDVSQQVSWDRPYPGNKSVVWQMAELILSNLVFVLILGGFAVVGGVFIFIVKRLTAKWLAHSAWARPDDGELIRLKLL